MATTLKAVLQFTAVPAGGTATLAHGLNVSGTAVVPDAVALDNPAFDYVSSTTTTVTVVNNDTAAGSCDVLCERWHTVERAFGDGAATLPVVPFISRGAAAGGGAYGLLHASLPRRAAEHRSAEAGGGGGGGGGSGTSTGGRDGTGVAAGVKVGGVAVGS